ARSPALRWPRPCKRDTEMPQKTWAAFDDYVCNLFGGNDPALERALANSDAAGLPPISVSPGQGKFLNLLARAKNAKAILEMGTLGGYSTIWLARALPQTGRRITLELDAKFAEV